MNPACLLSLCSVYFSPVCQAPVNLKRLKASEEKWETLDAVVFMQFFMHEMCSLQHNWNYCALCCVFSHCELKANHDSKRGVYCICDSSTLTHLMSYSSGVCSSVFTTGHHLIDSGSYGSHCWPLVWYFYHIFIFKTCMNSEFSLFHSVMMNSSHWEI